MKSLCTLTIAVIVMLLSVLIPFKSQASDDSGVVVSAGAGWAPDYEGSRNYEAVPLLFLHAGFPTGRFVAFNGAGLSANVIKSATWQTGPVMNFRPSRSEVENSRVAGLREVDGAVEAGAFVGLSVGPWKIKLTATHDVVDGHNGALIEVEGSYGLPIGEKSSLAFSLSTVYADAAYMDTYFSVDPDNALRSGLQTFQAAGGLKDVGAALLYSRTLPGKWAVNGVLKYSRLLGDAADSPLVAREGDADQMLFGLFTSYQF